MGRECAEHLVLVSGHCVQTVNIKHAVRVDSNQDAAHVGVDEVADQ